MKACIAYVKGPRGAIGAIRGMEGYGVGCGVKLVKLRASRINGRAYHRDMCTKDARGSRGS